MAKRGIRRKRGLAKNNTVQGSEASSNAGQENARMEYAIGEKNNDKFFEYYLRQQIVKEDEWERFAAALKEDLPTSFRIQNRNGRAERLIDEMQRRYFPLMAASDDKDVCVPTVLLWYPWAFQTAMSRTAVRSNPILAQFHNFLVTEAELGHISRQEAVSMIPPLLLDIKSSHKVLDVCAAPGSKTMQIIELMHAETDVPQGLLVANDVDNVRCYLLVKQALKRMPSANCVIINEDAANLPAMFIKREKESHAKEESENLPTEQPSEAPGYPMERLLFDRVLCDVPCSGDGTFRKNRDLWQKWTPRKALDLHKLQVNIAQRSIFVLDYEGLMVYSTCSLNPIEDEAVVAAVLRYAGDAVELVDVSGELPSLKRAPGVSFWKVIDDEMKEYNSIAEVPVEKRRLIVPSMFPPTEAEAQSFHLERCFRVLPHSQNTGGFFVAVFRKMAVISKERERLAFRMTPHKRKKKTFREDPFVFLTEGDDRWNEISTYYGVDASFSYQNVLCRNAESERKRTLYYVNDLTKQFLECNLKKIKVINAGMKVFGRVETSFRDCQFRITQDGVKFMLPYLTKRVFTIEKDDMCKILKLPGERTTFPLEDLGCKNILEPASAGSVVLVAAHEGVLHAICAWKGARTVAAYISKEERVHILRALGYDTINMEDELLSKRQMKSLQSKEQKAQRKLNGEINEVVRSLTNALCDDKTASSSGIKRTCSPDNRLSSPSDKKPKN